MAYEILPSPHPHLAQLRIYGTLALEDMACDAELGLNGSIQRAVLCDVSEMAVWLPDSFLDGAKTSFFVNPNMLHLALVITSPLLRSVALMVGKVTNRRDRMTLHPTVASAETQVNGLLRKMGL